MADFAQSVGIKAECSVPGCSRAPLSRGLCNAHYLRQRKGAGLLLPIEPRRKGLICLVTDCRKPTAPHGGHGLCRLHYRRWLRQSRTERLVLMLGGKCRLCSAIYPAVVYDFHHRNPAEKSFSISNQVENRSMKELEREAKKCDLLCANCHRLHHFGKNGSV